jgi:hypothetical protein
MSSRAASSERAARGKTRTWWHPLIVNVLSSGVVIADRQAAFAK